MRPKRGKRLGGAPPRKRWGRTPRRGAPRRERNYGVLFLIATGLFLVGGIAGFGWMLNRQLEEGILQQRAQAMEREDWVSLAEVPPHLTRAVLIAVDPNFLERETFAPPAQGRNLTLSRSLARQLYGLDEGLDGYARELLMGPLLETHLSDRALLELYLNRVRFGERSGWEIYGVRHAAEEYFGKEPGELTAGESATLAGILLAPRIEDPERRSGAVGARRNEILRGLLEEGVIDERTFREALTERLAFQPGPAFTPMSRPAGWDREPEPIRLVAPERPPEEDSPPEG